MRWSSTPVPGRRDHILHGLGVVLIEAKKVCDAPENVLLGLSVEVETAVESLVEMKELGHEDGLVVDKDPALMHKGPEATMDSGGDDNIHRSSRENQDPKVDVNLLADLGQEAHVGMVQRLVRLRKVRIGQLAGDPFGAENVEEDREPMAHFLGISLVVFFEAHESALKLVLGFLPALLVVTGHQMPDERRHGLLADAVTGADLGLVAPGLNEVSQCVVPSPLEACHEDEAHGPEGLLLEEGRACGDG